VSKTCWSLSSCWCVPRCPPGSLGGGLQPFSLGDDGGKLLFNTQLLLLHSDFELLVERSQTSYGCHSPCLCFGGSFALDIPVLGPARAGPVRAGLVRGGPNGPAVCHCPCWLFSGRCSRESSVGGKTLWCSKRSLPMTFDRVVWIPGVPVTQMRVAFPLSGVEDGSVGGITLRCQRGHFLWRLTGLSGFPGVSATGRLPGTLLLSRLRMIC